MVFFSEITPSNSNYNFVEQLFVDAFPPEERRKEEDQRETIVYNPFMHCLLVSDVEGTPLGFLTYWRFSDFTYIEHFAVSPGFRNQGIGGDVISAFLQMQRRPVVLEAETPSTSAMAFRRVGFYLRNDFHQLPDVYIQPPYPGRNTDGVPLVLMLFAEDGSKVPSFSQIQQTLYREVYGVKVE